MEVTLRKWQESDKNSLAYYANNEKISDCVRNTFPYPYTIEDAEFFIRLARHAHSDREWMLAIDVDGEAIGGITLNFGNDIHERTAELGYWGSRWWANMSACTTPICRSPKHSSTPATRPAIL